MATDLEKLVVQLSADVRQYERAMAKANGITNTRARQIERRWTQANTRIATQLKTVGAAFGFAFGGIAAIRGAQQLIDASTRVTNALKVAGFSGEELGAVYDKLFSSAQRNSVPIETLVQLFSRASLAQKELGVTTEELIGFTDKIALALRAGGKSAQESSGALLQLSQALGSGIVRAEEFNSLLEGAPTIAQAAAAGIAEAGGSVAKLRQLVVDGKLSSEAFFRGFEAGSVTLEEKVAGAAATTEQGFTRLSNTLIRAAGNFETATGASRGFTGALNLLADGILAATDRTSPLIEGIQAYTRAIDEATQATADFWANPNARNAVRMLLGDDIANVVTPGQTVNRGAKGDRAPVAQPGAAAPTVPTISIADFPAAGTKAAGKTTADRAERDRQAVLQLLDSLEEERRLVGASDVERAVSNALRQAGAAATDEQRAKIEALVRATQAETDALAAVTKQMEDAEGLARDFAGSLVDDLIEGKNATEALANAFANLGKRLLNIALDNAIGALFGNLFGGGATGAPMNLLPRAAGGPVKAGQPYIVGEKRPELFVPNQNGMIIPKLPAAGGGGVTVNVPVNINAPGADSAGLAGLTAEVRTLQRTLPSSVVKIVRDAQSRRVLA